MRTIAETRTWMLAGAVALTACGSGDDGRDTATTTPTTTPSTTSTTATETTPTSTDAAGTTTPATTGDGSTSTTADTTDTSTGSVDATSSGEGPKLDVGSDTGPGCTPDDTCCQEEGFIPPHTLLETFLAAYPAANMPKSDEALVVFEPVADGHTMAFSMENVGDEFVDPGQGGVIEANILAGRAYSRTLAEAAVPMGATVLEVREDPVTIEMLGDGDNGCIGVGWAWGSIIFTAEDESIGELVYLYVGHCYDGDAEAFFYSEESVELCPAPG